MILFLSDLRESETTVEYNLCQLKLEYADKSFKVDVRTNCFVGHTMHSVWASLK